MACALLTTAPRRIAHSTRILHSPAIRLSSSSSAPPDDPSTSSSTPSQPSPTRPRPRAQPLTTGPAPRNLDWLASIRLTRESLSRLPTQIPASEPIDLARFDPQLDFDPGMSVDFGAPANNPLGPTASVHFINAEKSPLWESMPPPVNRIFASERSDGHLMLPDSQRTPNVREIKPRDLMRAPVIFKAVQHQTGKGKIFGLYTMVIVGDGEGLVGIGEGKDPDGSRAWEKAMKEAYKNMMWIERRDGRTIWGERMGKMGATKVTLRERPVGFGLRANHYITRFCRVAGITDLSGEVMGAQTGMNIIKLTASLLGGVPHPLGLGDPLSRKAGHRADKGQGMMTADEIGHARGRRAVPVT